ncbi:MAG: hypothetical protein HY655_03915, partial [Acidobacteria bacterium]|nr:hypothetical protein [Acidobacteriota bacterium]
MIVLSGADLILPDRILSSATLVVEGSRIADIRESVQADSARALPGHYIVPGFIDVHVHGIEGVDTLGGAAAIESIAGRLPRFGVTAFCPTTVACPPDALRLVLEQVRRARETPPRGARVLPAHLESNFINAEYKGAQPAACLRSPRAALQGRAHTGPAGHEANAPSEGGNFDGADILREIERAASDVGIVTVAPELDGG